MVAVAVLAVVSAVALKSHFSSSATTTSSVPASSTTAPSSTTTTSRPATSPSAVGAVTLVLREPATATLGVRTLATTVRYPATGPPGGPVVPGATPLRRAGPYPLVVFSQGFDIAPEAYARLLNSWAAAGFVVADPTYPFTSPNAPGGVVRTDIVHHPTDLSFVITSLVQNSSRGGVLAGLINPSQIGVIGQSDGGDVTLAASANSCCRDARIKAAVILSGAELSWFAGSYFATPAVPMLVVQGTADLTMNPVTCSVQLYNAAPQPKYYLSMIGQTHLSAYVPPGPAQRVVIRVTTDFLNAYLRHRSSSLEAMTSAGNVAGLASITNQASLPPVSGTCPDAPAG